MARSKRRSETRRKQRGWALRQGAFWLWLVVVTSLVLVYSVPEEYHLSAGDVAPQSIEAPRDLTYISDILTQQARDDAARRVAPRYTPPDPTVARQQYTRARDVLAFLRAVRADPYGSEAQRSAAIQAVPELSDLPQDTVLSILALPDTSWSRVQLEFLDLLDQVMRQEEIREADLPSVRARIPTLVPLDLAQDEAEVVQDLVTRFVRPNVFYDEAATLAAQDAARQAVGPAVQMYRSGQVIVREGTIVSSLDIEALSQFGLTSATQSNSGAGVAVLFSALGVFVAGLFVHRTQPDALDGGHREVLIVSVFTLFLGLCWLLLRSGALLPYLFPGAAAAMLLATTVGSLPAAAAAMLLGVVSGWVGARSLEIGAMVAVGGLYAVLTLPRYEQTGRLFRSGLIAGLVQALVVFVFSVDELSVSPLGLAMKLGACVIGGLIAGGLTVGGLFVLTSLFDLTTTFRLTELSRPNHPLLQRLLREAPATFNHVMMVASLAEQAAERIGANALLTRVGAYYHDIGKLARPYFFVENQQGLSNPHDRLDPYASLDVLAGHVRDGVELAKQYHLPSKVRAFIPEHHGTMRVSFLYQKAVEAAGGEADLVDESQFRYPGPVPQSRETLLVMLADGSEAATRARRPGTAEDLAAVVDYIFQQRMQDGQLDGAPITMAELHQVRQTYVDLLRGAFHPRVQYPEPLRVPQRRQAEEGEELHAQGVRAEALDAAAGDSAVVAADSAVAAADSAVVADGEMAAVVGLSSVETGPAGSNGGGDQGSGERASRGVVETGAGRARDDADNVHTSTVAVEGQDTEDEHTASR